MNDWIYKRLPNKEGLYWFYGIRNKCSYIEDEKCELLFCRVHKNVNGFSYVIEGCFAYVEEFGEYWWFKRVDYPILSEEILECEKAFKKIIAEAIKLRDNKK